MHLLSHVLECSWLVTFHFPLLSAYCRRKYTATSCPLEETWIKLTSKNPQILTNCSEVAFHGFCKDVDLILKSDIHLDYIFVKFLFPSCSELKVCVCLISCRQSWEKKALRRPWIFLGCEPRILLGSQWWTKVDSVTLTQWLNAKCSDDGLLSNSFSLHIHFFGVGHKWRSLRFSLFFLCLFLHGALCLH